MGLAFVPIYIRFLGMEAYGLIGIFALLQSWLTILDLGLTPTLSREVARFRAGAHTSQSIRELVHSVEIACLAIALIVVVGVVLAAPWLALDWIRTEKLSSTTVANALAVMGGIIGARWLASLYRSALNGLQRQVWLNICTATFATFRGLGAVAILAFVSPTIMAFFIFQMFLTGLEVVVLRVQLRRLLPPPPFPTRFSWQALRQVWRFAAGMTALTLLSILLTQVDKLLLTRLLPLAEFGYYALASTVTAALALLVTPISNAIYPRLTELVARGDNLALADSYHKSSQMLSFILIPAGLVLALFSHHIILLWTRDAATTMRVAPLVSVLAIGATLNGLMNIPYTLQLAFGWTRFMIVVNTASVLIITPLIFFGVRAYGVFAAAWLWASLNAAYIVITVPIMHRKLLPSEMWRWYCQDTILPAVAAVATTMTIRVMTSDPVLGRPMRSFFDLAIASGAAIFAAMISTPIGRTRLREYVRPLLKTMRG